MKKNISVSEPVIQKNGYKRTFSLIELYRSFMFAPRAIAILRSNNKSKTVDTHLVERIQLAITEVNGCAACSHHHTKMALKQGMSNEEITSFLSGGNDFIKPEEAKAILFAQHFADARGFPKKYAFDAIVSEYGDTKGKIMLAASQMMLAGNTFGIPWSAFLSRLQGKKYKNSSLFYELGMLLMAFLFLPVAILHGITRGWFGLANERFDTSAELTE